MKVKLEKLFPISCELQNIGNVEFDTKDIQSFGVVLEDESPYHQLLVNGIEYKFAPLDNGLSILAGIITCETIIDCFDNNKTMVGIDDKRLRNLANISKDSLKKYALMIA